MTGLMFSLIVFKAWICVKINKKMERNLRLGIAFSSVHVICTRSSHQFIKYSRSIDETWITTKIGLPNKTSKFWFDIRSSSSFSWKCFCTYVLWKTTNFHLKIPIFDFRRIFCSSNYSLNQSNGDWNSIFHTDNTSKSTSIFSYEQE